MPFAHSTRRILPFAAVLSLVLPVATAGPPKVVRATPDHGAQSVDPNTRFIRVEFDQDMAEGSHSWVGGGESFPKIRGMPYWESPRVAVLPVELDSDHEYHLSINNPNFQNFRGRGGEPATPYPLSFRTGPATPVPDPAARALEENKAAIPVLRRTLERYYSYYDLRKVDWDAAFKQYKLPLETAPRPFEWGKLAGELLSKAGDMHITLRQDRNSFPSLRREVVVNVNKQTLRKVVPNWKQESRCVASGRFDDGIGYLAIASWEQSFQEDLKVLPRVLDQLKDCKALIIDVRLNSGGDEGYAQAFAGRFVAKPVVYAKHVLRWPDEPGGFSPVQERVLRPVQDGPTYRGKVAVLIGKENMSSCEAFILMMKQVPGCKLVGEQTYGSSGNPQGYGLPNGVIVYLPCWKSMTPAGEFFEGVGLAPDVAVPTNLAEFEQRDPVIEAALRVLGK